MTRYELLSRRIHEAVGTASVCWTGDRVFDEDAAERVAKGLLREVEAVVFDYSEWLDGDCNLIKGEWDMPTDTRSHEQLVKDFLGEESL